MGHVKLDTIGKTFAVAVAAGTLATLTACGSDNNTGTASSSASGSASTASAAGVNCGGAKTLKSSGSTAQANAMTRFVKAFETACPARP